MKKALSYMMIGALGATLVLMYNDNKNSINKKMRKLKCSSMDAINKVKTMF